MKTSLRKRALSSSSESKGLCWTPMRVSTAETHLFPVQQAGRELVEGNAAVGVEVHALHQPLELRLAHLVALQTMMHTARRVMLMHHRHALVVWCGDFRRPTEQHDNKIESWLCCDIAASGMRQGLILLRDRREGSKGRTWCRSPAVSSSLLRAPDLFASILSNMSLQRKERPRLGAVKCWQHCAPV